MVKVAVIGCGLQGIKVAGELALHGHRVKLHDQSQEALDSAYLRVQEDKQELQQQGLMSNPNFLGQILCMSRLEETLKDVDFVFEAVSEDMAVKQDLFRRISEHCKPDAVLASNSMLLDITQIGEHVENKERLLGLRFLYPVYFIPEVEITPGRFTSADTIEKARDLLERMGKTLFFRSGGEPLVLSDEQREARKMARLQQMTSQGYNLFYENAVPQLTHRTSLVSTDLPLPSPTETTDCAICMTNPRDSLLCPCHHMVTCNECAQMLHNRGDCCPICRKKISSLIHVYQA